MTSVAKNDLSLQRDESLWNSSISIKKTVNGYLKYHYKFSPAKAYVHCYHESFSLCLALSMTEHHEDMKSLRFT